MSSRVTGSMLKLLLPFVAALSTTANPQFPRAEAAEYDIVIYGGTSAGVTAAVQAARMKRSVVLIEPSRHVGGLTTAGLGMTDTGSTAAIGGIAREFYQRVRRHYERPEAWNWQRREDYPHMRAGEDALWRFEPKVAEAVLREMLKEVDVPVVHGRRLDLRRGVVKEGTRVVAVRMESGDEYRGRIFIDATYEGDLMAGAGVDYTVGREANSKYGETLNGVQTRNARSHQFQREVDPYVVPGDPDSGLLPGVHGDGPGREGEADKRVQAYCFRLCLTDVPENRAPFPKPAGYDPLRYELLRRYLTPRWNDVFGNHQMMPNGKSDTNNHGGFGSDNIGMNYDYPEGDYETRQRIIDEHRAYQQGMYWFLVNDPRVPEQVRSRVSRWGLAKDEFVDNDNWPHQLYIREARRMVSDYVHTEMDCRRTVTTPESVGMGSYNMDSHNVQRYVDSRGLARNEGDVQVSPGGPYQISYRSIRPKAEQCSNLLVPVCVSSSHIAYGSIRMEPVFMILGQSAATAASLAIERDQAVQEVDYGRLSERLSSDKQVLDLPRRAGASAASLDVRELKGIVVDDDDARRQGAWIRSVSVGPFVGDAYRHDGDQDKGLSEARFETTLKRSGRYEVRLAYTAHENRASNVPVTVEHAEGRTTVRVDQRARPKLDGAFVSLGTFSFDAAQPGVVTVGTAGTEGYVIVDAVQWIEAPEFAAAEASGWPQWRGPTADGVAAGGDPPVHWDERTNVAWKVELPGEGSSTPIVWRDRIYLTAAVSTDEVAENPPPAHEEALTRPPANYHEFVVLCLDRDTGGTIWRQTACKQVPHEGRHKTNTYAASSPTTDGRRLYVSFGSRGIYCYHLDGQLLWQRDLGDMRTRFGWGEATSPVVRGDSLVVNWDHEDQSFITALDATTGEIRWKVERDEPTSWNTPLITEFDGREQVIVNGTVRSRSYDLRDGRLIWECGGQTVNAIPSPVRHEDIVVCMSGYRGAAAMAIPLSSRGDLTEVSQLRWHHGEGTPYVPSPVVAGKRIYFTRSNSAVLTGLSVETGEVEFGPERIEGLTTLYASPVLADDRIYYVDRDGSAVVLSAEDRPRVLATNRLDDSFDASPVVVGDRLFLRGARYLYCLKEN